MTEASLTASRSLAWTAPLTILLLVLIAVFLLLGARGVFDPAGGAASLGLAVANASDLALMQAVGARNIGLAILGLALIILDVRLAVGCLLLVAALIAGLDFCIVNSASGLSSAVKHAAYVVVLAGFGWVTLRGGA